MSSFADKVALVVGATRGIGRAAAIAFAREGARVVVVAGRHESMGEETVRLAREAGGEAVYVRADVTVEEDVAALVERAVADYGRLDCAFNNAGFEAMGPLVDQTERNSDATLDTNVKGVFFCLKHEIRAMKQTGGAIVNESSLAGLKGIPDNSLYTASKHAVIGLTKAAALENARFGIRVNALCPSAIDGEMLRGFMAHRGISEEQLLANVPIGCVGKPEDVAEAVLFLCSDRASYITGATLEVDGGMSAG